MDKRPRAPAEGARQAGGGRISAQESDPLKGDLQGRWAKSLLGTHLLKTCSKATAGKGARDSGPPLPLLGGPPGEPGNKDSGVGSLRRQGARVWGLRVGPPGMPGAEQLGQMSRKTMPAYSVVTHIRRLLGAQETGARGARTTSPLQLWPMGRPEHGGGEQGSAHLPGLGEIWGDTLCRTTASE